MVLSTLVRQGKLTRVCRGLYALPDRPASEHATLAEVAKTVADCFKYRNKIGLDVALEALREAWNAKRVKMDDLWRCAQVCRVANVMRPYLEALT